MNPEEVVHRVLLAASLIPEGRVVSYGDVAALVGTSARRVGSIMRWHGREVPWWRLVGFDGTSAVVDEAGEHWEREGIVIRRDGRGCDMTAHRAHLGSWAKGYDAALSRGVVSWTP